MTRPALTDADRYHIRKAREELAAIKTLDLTDSHATAHAIGRLEVAMEQLLETLAEIESR